MPPTAEEFSLRLFFKVLISKMPEKLDESVVESKTGEIMKLSREELENMTRLCRRSWRVRVLRYAVILPIELFDMDPKSLIFRIYLKEWMRTSIYKDSDFIFQVKVKPPKYNDWLIKELSAWRGRQEHDIISSLELEEVLE